MPSANAANVLRDVVGLACTGSAVVVRKIGGRPRRRHRYPCVGASLLALPRCQRSDRLSTLSGEAHAHTGANDPASQHAIATPAHGLHCRNNGTIQACLAHPHEVVNQLAQQIPHRWQDVVAPQACCAGTLVTGLLVYPSMTSGAIKLSPWRRRGGTFQPRSDVRQARGVHAPHAHQPTAALSDLNGSLKTWAVTVYGCSAM